MISFLPGKPDGTGLVNTSMVVHLNHRTVKSGVDSAILDGDLGTVGAATVNLAHHKGAGLVALGDPDGPDGMVVAGDILTPVGGSQKFPQGVLLGGCEGKAPGLHGPQLGGGCKMGGQRASRAALAGDRWRTGHSKQTKGDREQAGDE